MISNAKAQGLNQTYVMAYGTLINLLKLPDEIIWGITRPFKEKAYQAKVKAFKDESKLKTSNLTCEEKCFDDLRILSFGRKRMIPDSGKNLLSFLNERKDFADHIQRTVGYCWGHSSVSRNFNYLAYFEPALRLEDESFYKKKIKSIMRGNAEVIPGFSNLREFSSDEVIKKLLKDEVVWKWADKALRLRSIGASLKGFKGLMKKKELLSFLSEVKEKLSVNHTPKIFFSNLKKPGFIHVVNVYNVIEEKDMVKLCILDNHQYEDQQRNCGVFVSIKLDGSENFYDGWDKSKRQLEGFVGQFGFTPEDDVEILKFQKENTKMCLKRCGK